MRRQKRRDATSGAPLSEADFRHLADFRRHLRQFLAFSESAARSAGLSPQQHQALLAIKGFADGAPSIGDLAESLAIRHHSTVGLVDRLADAGLIRRETDAADRRRVTVALTGKGERILARLSAVHRSELKRMSPLLKPLLAQFEK